MRKLLLLLLAVGFAVTQLQAQTRTISGKVTDDAGAPIPNASILIKGTATGTTSKEDGTFSLSVPQEARTLIFSAIGYDSQDIAIRGRSEINISLQAATDKDLQEVVVVGYGTQKRRELTGSIAQIGGNKVKDVPVQSFDQALSGRAAGVNISMPNGVLGNPPVVRIRGTNSISLSSFPLVVIDGMPTFTGDVGGTASNNVLSNLNPTDIESIEVLKDASAAAIYGSRAAAGVLLITTKKGKQGRARVNYDGWVGWTSAYNLIEVLNAQEFTDIKNEGLTNANSAPNGTTRGFYTMNDANGKLVDTRWYDHVYRTGVAHNHNLSVSGANDKTSYYFSANYTKQEGMIRNNDFRRLSGRFTIDHKVNNWFTVGGTFNYTNGFNNGINTGSTGAAFNTSGGARLAFALAPNVSPYNADGSYNINTASNQIGQGANLTSLAFTNPVLLLDKNVFTSESDRILSNFYGQIKLPFGVTYRTMFGIDYMNVINNEFRTGEHGDGVQFGGASQNTTARFKRWNWQHTLQYDKTFGDDHNFSILLGNEQQKTTSNGWGADRRGVADGYFNEYQGTYANIVPAGNLIGENYLLSYFGRVNYNFKEKYFISFNGRRDGYSAFAPDKKWGNFGGGSLGWAVSEEEFFKNSGISKIVSSFRLRGSYGEVGNANGLGDFASYTLFASGLYGSELTFFFSQAGNQDLAWEKSKKTDVGFNIGFLNDRITAEFAYYKNNIDGLILGDPQAPSRGIPGNSILRNIGSMYNKGVELTINALVVKGKDFTWNTSLNVTTQTNKVTALATGNADILVSTGGLESPSIIRVGESVGSFYAVRTGGVNPDNGNRIFYYRDGTQIQYNHVGSPRWTKMDGTPAPRGADQASDGVLIGPALPKWFGGWENTFRYQGFDLNVLVYFSGGNYVYNGTKAGLHDNRVWNSAKDVLNRWQKPGDVTNIPRIVFGDNVSNGSSMVISENVEKGDFLKVRNIAIGYTLPKTVTDRFKISSVRFYVAALNPFTITGYSGFDPEISSNGNANGGPSVDRNSVPLARTLNFGLNVGF